MPGGLLRPSTPLGDRCCSPPGTSGHCPAKSCLKLTGPFPSVQQGLLRTWNLPCCSCSNRAPSTPYEKSWTCTAVKVVTTTESTGRVMDQENVPGHLWTTSFTAQLCAPPSTRNTLIVLQLVIAAGHGAGVRGPRERLLEG
ncbi:hypothetical protein GJAV_G00000350 [Gymnothorax javanicus]|nr:hypothetical protein GJAV_G00000350 [Gymnothorax javanicus]